MKKAFVGLALSTVLLALSFPSAAQQAKKVARVGFVAGPRLPNTHDAFGHGLRELYKFSTIVVKSSRNGCSI
jgi:hypothetical protein